MAQKTVRKTVQKRAMIILAAGALLGALLLAGGGVASAGGGDKESRGKTAVKLPSPASVLQTAVKNLTKAKSYRAKVDIVGGFAEKADHEVLQPVVKDSYEGEVYGAMMVCPEIKAYRTLKKGAAFIDGQWRDVLSTRTTVKMERLFKFPETILAKALKHAPRNARWLKKTESGSGIGDGAVEALEKAVDSVFKTEGEDSSAETPASTEVKDGKTIVVTKPKEGDATAVVMPRFLLIETPPEEALTHLIEVQNSNCFGGG